jgi:ubiquinone/menaquinone biosynthesis C-methylase UbiE
MIAATGARFVHPDVVTSHFHFREGDRVADFGAGMGYFAKALSQFVGNDGRVYACDIQRNLVDALGKLKQDKQLSNLEPLWCDVESPRGTKLADGVLDGGICVNTLFQFENKHAALTEIARVIRRGGKFFVIDWSESFSGLGPAPTDVVSASEATKLVEAVGFRSERTFPAGDHHYGLAFRRV